MVIPLKSTLFTFLLLLGLSEAAAGDPEPSFDQESMLSLEELLSMKLIGSRRLTAGFTKISAAPYDIITMTDLSRQSSGDLNEALRNLLPSYNVATQPNLDEASFMRPPNLRGLAPDHILVLSYGKRRHRGALLTFLGGGVSDGAQGVDLAAIPTFALKSVQILRDGAAAQYGSDAIAGILNLEFKEHTDGLELRGENHLSGAGDGEITTFAANYGLTLFGDGFLNATVEISDQNRTERQVQRADAAWLAVHNDAVPNPAQTWGRPDIHDQVKVLVNAAVPFDNETTLYALSNYARRTVDSVFYYRSPNGGDRPSRYSNDGGATLLVGDLIPDNDRAAPVIPIINGNPVTSPGYELVADSDEFFAWTEVRPGGFTPIFSAHVSDASLLVGWRGVLETLHIDFSAYHGYSKAFLFLQNSINPSNPNSNPDRAISPGAFAQSETIVNADLAYPWDIGLPSSLVLSGGFEWREEELEVSAGEPDSYMPGPLADQGFRSTVDGYTGIRPEAAGAFARANWAIFGEAETDLTRHWLLGVSIRYEDFEDFGDTLNTKLGTAVQINEHLDAHFTASTGFRAPTPGQSHLQRTSTVVFMGDIIESGILPPTSRAAAALSAVIPGAPIAKPLQPETSENLTLGFIYENQDTRITLDGFYIDLADRISLSPFISTQSSDYSTTEQAAIDAVLGELTAAGIPGADTINSFQFFRNDFDTRTHGIDLNAEIDLHFSPAGRTRVGLYGNYTETKVVERATNTLDATRVALLENALPKTRWNLAVEHQSRQGYGLVRLRWFDSFTIVTDAEPGFDGRYGAKALLDLGFGLNFGRGLRLQAGIDNLLDTEPDRLPNPAQNSGALFPEESPFGFHGRFYHLRLGYKKR